MKEYWVNVYEDNVLGMKFDKLEHAKQFTSNGWRDIIYRIHVKMKENKPKYEPSGIVDSFL